MLQLSRLSARAVGPGERWIYSAGFNVRKDLQDRGRIDCEIFDLKRLLSAGARVSILSHQGSYRDGSARPLDFVADYISKRIGRNVSYVENCCGSEAEAIAAKLAPGEAALFGNTRMQRGEEVNDPNLAVAFSRLGEHVAVGGFCKGHREHASNFGLLKHRQGYAADSLIREIALLAPWAGRKPEIQSLAVIGGTKKEKLSIGLEGFSNSYDAVLLTGAVLNCCLKALGHEIGLSHLGEDPKGGVEIARSILSRTNHARLLFPRQLLIARKVGECYCDGKSLPVGMAVPQDHAIVDFLPDGALRSELNRAAALGGRLLLAGTPGLILHGFRGGSDACLDAMSHPAAKSIVLGGDSVAELNFGGQTSTGGGAALYFLVKGDMPVLAALRSSAS